MYFSFSEKYVKHQFYIKYNENFQTVRGVSKYFIPDGELRSPAWLSSATSRGIATLSACLPLFWQYVFPNFALAWLNGITRPSQSDFTAYSKYHSNE